MKWHFIAQTLAIGFAIGALAAGVWHASLGFTIFLLVLVWVLGSCLSAAQFRASFYRKLAEHLASVAAVALYHSKDSDD